MVNLTLLSIVKRRTQTGIYTSLQVTPPNPRKERDSKVPLQPTSKSYATRREPEGGEPSREDFHREWLSSSLRRSASKQRTPREPDDNETERPLMAYLPYVAGVSERIRKVCRNFNIRTGF